MKKGFKFLYIIILVICGLDSAYCQFIYTKQSNSTNNFTSICEEIGTNNYLLTTHTQTINSTTGYFNTEGQIIKLSSIGVVLNTVTLDSNFWVLGPIVNDGTNYFIPGGKWIGNNINTMSWFPTIVKYDLNLNKIKEIKLDSTQSVCVPQNLIFKKNSLYISYDLQNESKIKFFKLDQNLNKKDSALFTGTYLCNLSSLGNKLIMSGGGFPSGSAFGNNQVVELDTNFNVLSRFNLDSLTTQSHVAGTANCSQKVGMTYYYNNLHEINPNEYLVSGYYNVINNSSCNMDHQNIVSLIKNNNTVIATLVLGKTGIHDLYRYPVLSSHNKYNFTFNIACSGYNLSNPFPPQSNPTEIMINKIDTSCNLVWINYFNTPNYYYSPLGVYASNDSGVVICGIRYNLSAPTYTNVCEGFVLKLDKNGVIQYTGINDKDIIQKPIVNIYPNPASKEITLEINSNDYFELEIYNSFGELVKYETGVKEKTTINTEGLPQGLYHFILNSNKKNYSGKFIKQ